MNPVSLPTEDWSSGARPFQRLLLGRCQSGGLSSLRREALARQYYFQAKIDDRCPRSRARTTTQLYQVPAPDPLAESPQLMSESIDRQSKQPHRYCLLVSYRFRSLR
jgi:hypothetical protein